MVFNISKSFDLSSTYLTLDFCHENFFLIDKTKKDNEKILFENFFSNNLEKKKDYIEKKIFYQLDINYEKYKKDKDFKDFYFLIIFSPFNINRKKKLDKLLEIKNQDLKKDLSEKEKKNLILLKSLACDIPIDIKKIETIKRKFNFVNEKLNSNQKNVITNSLNSQNYYLIHGPPGTGKTTILSEILRLLSFEKKKILLIAPTVAIDNIIINVKKFEKKFFKDLKI